MLVLTVYLFRIVGFDFIPRDDQSDPVRSRCPRATRCRADSLFAEIEGRLAKLKGVTNVFSTIGDTTGRVSRGQGDVTAGTIYARLADLKPRTRQWWDWKFWYLGALNLPEDDPRYFTQFDVQRGPQGHGGYLNPVHRPGLGDGLRAGFRQAMIDLNLRGPGLIKLRSTRQDHDLVRQHPSTSTTAVCRSTKPEYVSRSTRSVKPGHPVR
jgi:HAE1 family hydrophobic/amphiphilic exporter-1